MSRIVPKFGEIFYADLKRDGSVQGGCRPVIIAQNDIGNAHSPIVEVIPMTSKHKAEYMPTHVLITADDISGLDMDSVAMAEQVRVIPKTSLRQRVGQLKHSELVGIGKARSIQSPFPMA